MAFAQIGHAAAASTLPYMNPIHHHAHSMVPHYHRHPHHQIQGNSPKSDNFHVDEGFGVPPNYEVRNLTQSWEANECLSDGLSNTLSSPTNLRQTSWYGYNSQTNDNTLTENQTTLSNNSVGDQLSPIDNRLVSSTSYNYEFAQSSANSHKVLTDDLLDNYQHSQLPSKEIPKMNCKILGDAKLSTDYITDDKISPTDRNSIDMRHLDGDSGFQANHPEGSHLDAGYTPYLNKLFATKALFTEANVINRIPASYTDVMENKPRDIGSWNNKFGGSDHGNSTNTGVPESRDYENFISHSDCNQRDEEQHFSSIFNSSNSQQHPFTKLIVSEPHVPSSSECLSQSAHQHLNEQPDSPTRMVGNSLTTINGAPPSDANVPAALQAVRPPNNPIPLSSIGSNVPVTSLNNFLQRSIPSTNVYSQILHTPNAQVYPRPTPPHLEPNRFLSPNPYSFPGNMPPHPFMTRPHHGLYPPGQPGHLRPFAPSSLHHHHPHQPPGQHGFSYGLDGARRKNATRESTTTLKVWLQEHIKNPYPTKGEKIMLAIITKMTLTQVSTWFANARRRLKKENKMTWPAKSSGNSNPNHKSPNNANSTGGTKQLDDKDIESKNSQDHVDQSSDMSDEDQDEQASESEVEEIDEVDDFSGTDVDYDENYLKLMRMNQTEQHAISNMPQPNVKLSNYESNDRTTFSNNPVGFGRTSCDNIDKFKRQTSFANEEMFSPALTNHGFSQTAFATSQLNSRNTLSFMFGAQAPFHPYPTSPKAESYESHSQFTSQVTSEYLPNATRKSPSASSSFREDPEPHSNSSDPILISPNFMGAQQPQKASNISMSLENHEPGHDRASCGTSTSTSATITTYINNNNNNNIGSESVLAQTDRSNNIDPATPILHTIPSSHPNLTMLRTVDYTHLNPESMENYRLNSFTNPSFGIH